MVNPGESLIHLTWMANPAGVCRDLPGLSGYVSVLQVSRDFNSFGEVNCDFK